MESKHDELLLQILKDELNITNFLNTFFGFMYRCFILFSTDFYVESTQDQKLGFPAGVAEDLVLKIYRKWKSRFEADNLSRSEAQAQTSELLEPTEVVEVEVETSSNQIDDEPIKTYKTPVQPSDSYNGAVRENYTWSQTISDVDALVNIPSNIESAKDLRVDITAQKIRIAVKTERLRENNSLDKYSDDATDSEWIVTFDEELSFKTQREESMWCIIPGYYVHVHLEKATERWWEALTKGEPHIDLTKIDCSRPIEDLGANEQMKVQELMWNHQQKLLGKPTSEQCNLERVLKKAWNAEGSPFKGTEYDPSVLQYN
ncbi:nudC domain-containing protein 3 isoform X1 [Neodiprion virginianus]|uniref:nudC domain-containing protein 3 isoform X1 n=1 Tax=Neodiprion fabricii TaxID=2872261 RepID=UPI001ED8D281|nr:nudC domain-containing protein 3 isoform X1 [Neodiprion fabricii]XP_046605467.1 nudC domain-containing protein 3 isoform X1 [Neodiprion virginianus]